MSLHEKIELKKSTDTRINLDKPLSPKALAAAMKMKTARVNVLRRDNEREREQGYKPIRGKKSAARRHPSTLTKGQTILAHSEMNSYERIYSLITERRGRKSKAARKARGTEAERREGVFGAGLSRRGGAKQKQERINLDKDKTAVGATASNQADDPRRSPSLSTDHNSPENVKTRKHQVVIRRSDRANEKHAKAGQDRRAAIRAAADLRASKLPMDSPGYRPLP